MATIPPYNLLHPHVDQIAGLGSDPTGEEELERRAQELIFEWQTYYFSGEPFASPRNNGADVMRTFAKCEVLWDLATPTLPAMLPVLHTILSDRRDAEPSKISGGRYAHSGVWTWNTFVRTSPQFPAAPDAPPENDAAHLSALRLARKVRSQVAWLVRKPHAQDLSYKGLHQLKILNGPRSIASGSWILRQIVWSAVVRWHTNSNEP